MAGIRKRLKPDELELLDNYRAVKAQAQEAGIPVSDVKHGWYKSKEFSLFFKKSEVDFEKAKQEFIEDLKKYSPNFKTIKRTKLNDSHLLVIDAADVHIGKLASKTETGEDYNSEIAVDRFTSGVEGILHKANGFNIDKIVFVAGNDKLHTDTPRSTTTSGTPQDSDLMWYDQFKLARDVEIKIIESLLGVADIHYIYCPSNHDYMSGFFLSDVVKTYFRNSKNITFDTDMKHRKYYKYHDNLLGFTHGDGAKEKDLPLLMSIESSDWSSVKHRYLYKHHLHHAIQKDYAGISVQTLRSPSGADSWHHRNGFQHAPKAVEGFVHSKTHGQVAKLTHIF